FVYMTGNYDIYVCRYTPDGEYDKLLLLGGDDHDISYGIHPRNEEVIVFGYFRDNVDFDLTDGEMILEANFIDGFVAAYTLEALDLGTIDEDVNSIVIFPNPTSGDFQILLPEQHNYRSVQLINPMGKIISETPIQSINETININGESGIYFLRIISDTGESFSVKIIKI
ncbi:MAG: T9SS type A sorting domain-containing protein, partial [Crocinitomix sp.]|nr:T9SS type A sorting domain-containing protein [Crocinitomix sp.]